PGPSGARERNTETPSDSAPPTRAMTKYVRACSSHGCDAATGAGSAIHTTNDRTSRAKNQSLRTTTSGQPMNRCAASDSTAEAKIAPSASDGQASHDAIACARTSSAIATSASAAPAKPGKNRPPTSPTLRSGFSQGALVRSRTPTKASTPVELSWITPSEIVRCSEAVDLVAPTGSQEWNGGERKSRTTRAYGTTRAAITTPAASAPTARRPMAPAARVPCRRTAAAKTIASATRPTVALYQAVRANISTAPTAARSRRQVGSRR